MIISIFVFILVQLFDF